ncbi:NodA family N-acyltransferase [Mesorhizobium carmichaelinearum]|nr:NodA family N-acyltransferase [Mesorhizobium carmichaelinearum]
MSSNMQWKLCWESELTVADHAQLAEFFRTLYGPTISSRNKLFEGHRSWAKARPEFRAIGYDANGVVAHMGLLRRFIKVGEVEMLVAELGLYGVRQDSERLGITYSMRAIASVLDKLKVPFIFGAVRPQMRNHVERFCRSGFGTMFPAVPVRSTQPDVYPDLPPTRTDEMVVWVLPVEGSMSDWPAGATIDRNGPEL